MVIIILLLAAVAISVDKSVKKRHYRGGKSSDRRGEDTQKYHRKSFTVINIVDGDTVDIDVADLGFDRTRVRLLGVDTPETKNTKTGVMYFGPEAAGFTSQLTLNKEIIVLLDSVSATRDKFGRLLGYLQLEDGRVVNEELIRNGYGYADLRFAHSEFDKYEELGDQAFEAGLGLWKGVKREQLPGWVRRERPGLLE